jgi:hypothetical protein
MFAIKLSNIRACFSYGLFNNYLVWALQNRKYRNTQAVVLPDKGKQRNLIAPLLKKRLPN